MTRKQRNGKPWTMPGGIGLGVVMAMGWTIGMAILTGKLMDAERLAMESVGYASMVILVSAAWIGCTIAYGKIRKQKAMVCAMTASGYFLSLLAVTALFFGGQYRGIGATALMIVCGCALAMMVGNRAGKGKSRKTPQKLFR